VEGIGHGNAVDISGKLQKHLLCHQAAIDLIPFLPLGIDDGKHAAHVFKGGEARLVGFRGRRGVETEDLFAIVIEHRDFIQGELPVLLVAAVFDREGAVEESGDTAGNRQGLSGFPGGHQGIAILRFRGCRGAGGSGGIAGDAGAVASTGRD
jgi:hypothetical protein